MLSAAITYLQCTRRPTTKNVYVYDFHFYEHVHVLVS